MKKLLIVLLTITAFSSCVKNIGKDCKCSIITDKEIENTSGSTLRFTLTVDNDCSGNSRKFYVGQDTWIDSHISEPDCMGQIW